MESPPRTRKPGPMKVSQANSLVPVSGFFEPLQGSITIKTRSSAAPSRMKRGLVKVRLICSWLKQARLGCLRNPWLSRANLSVFSGP